MEVGRSKPRLRGSLANAVSLKRSVKIAAVETVCSDASDGDLCMRA